MSGCLSISENNECWSSSHMLSQPRYVYGNNFNHFNDDPGGACSWNGSVDVEDLAQLFSYRTNNKIVAYDELSSSSSKIQPTKHHRVFRRPINSTTRQYNTVDSAYATYSNQSCMNVCGSFNPLTIDQPDDFIGIATTNTINTNTNPLSNGIPCTEAQWLNCSITNCPFFDSVGTATSTPSNTNTWNKTIESNWNTSHNNILPFYNENFSFNEHNFYRESYPNCCPFRENTEEQQSEDFLEDYLSNEKRKEKSRDAARYRRSRETDIFVDLAASLPMKSDEATHLDKASVMRLAIAYLKARSVVNALYELQTIPQPDANMDQLIPKALDGFVLMISSNGDMIYLSENICDYLGVSQMELMGQNIYEYSHPCDHDELREYLLMKSEDIAEKRPVNFFLRLKCTLTSKGRKVNLKSASYKVIHCVGRPMITRESKIIAIENDDEVKHEQHESSDSGCDDMKDHIDNEISPQDNRASLVIVGCPIPHPSNIEVPLGRHTFLSKHNLNMKFTYVDERLSEYLGWNSEELIGKSIFEFHHALDNSSLDKSFKALFSKGQCETMAYRFLGKKGGYAWVVTQATLLHCVKQRKPLSVVCVNHILSLSVNGCCTLTSDNILADDIQCKWNILKL
ncbi:hypothetical protein PV326_009483 [Microctonus aethiopoides]|nr:hypothetical protein PV326_009483 [Microctonus aethiopoides]